MKIINEDCSHSQRHIGQHQWVLESIESTPDPQVNHDNNPVAMEHNEGVG
jgi:hypothetical protein